MLDDRLTLFIFMFAKSFPRYVLYWCCGMPRFSNDGMIVLYLSLCVAYPEFVNFIKNYKA